MAASVDRLSSLQTKRPRRRGSQPGTVLTDSGARVGSAIGLYTSGTVRSFQVSAATPPAACATPPWPRPFQCSLLNRLPPPVRLALAAFGDVKAYSRSARHSRARSTLDRKASVEPIVALPLASRKSREPKVRGIVATSVAIGVLWLADVLLNGGRYGEVVERGIITLIGR
jgi:hypothetical protein